MTALLSQDEKNFLLRIARQTLEATVCGSAPPLLERENIPPALLELGATFVTLTRQGSLRGCIGSLEAVSSLVDDVRDHTVAAALNDFRFAPVRPDELSQIQIEISRLTPPVALEYEAPQELPSRLRRGIDGVVLLDDLRRATFLPQVWEKIPDPEDFLTHLCLKMGVSPLAWRSRKMRVLTYQVEEFCESSAGGQA